MCGSWNGLQALFVRDSPQAYYVHCFAHRLQLALVADAEKESSIWLFFSKLTLICNLIKASPKHHTELQSSQAIEIENMVASGIRETGTGLNQIGTLQRDGKTRWSSHFESIWSMIDMYNSVIIVLKNLVEKASSNSIRGKTTGTLIALRSFVFAFILHLMHKIMGIPGMNPCYRSGTRRFCQQRDSITVGHHYHFDVFNVAIDFQVEELNNRFDDGVVELLRLNAALEPRDNFKLFNVDDIYNLAEKFYLEKSVGAL
ncbi:uncharacterized protein [Henckelia pumila]|uniref:uncharacterized protein n=1 Tax=Henckelia pumila TaxID=405737 RepID=UPI003C6DBB11